MLKNCTWLSYFSLFGFLCCSIDLIVCVVSLNIYNKANCNLECLTEWIGPRQSVFSHFIGRGLIALFLSRIKVLVIAILIFLLRFSGDEGPGGHGALPPLIRTREPHRRQRKAGAGAADGAQTSAQSCRIFQWIVLGCRRGGGGWDLVNEIQGDTNLFSWRHYLS